MPLTLASHPLPSSSSLHRNRSCDSGDPHAPVRSAPGEIASDIGSSEAPVTQEIQMANTSDKRQ